MSDTLVSDTSCVGQRPYPKESSTYCNGLAHFARSGIDRFKLTTKTATLPIPWVRFES